MQTNLTFEGSQDYVAGADLMSAVNISMALQKPLLIKGEPGTGKTKLAESIAAALGKQLIIWSIKSTTKAQDGLYFYDVVQRLNEILAANTGKPLETIKLDTERDNFMTAEEAQAYGLVDKVIYKRQ